MKSREERSERGIRICARVYHIYTWFCSFATKTRTVHIVHSVRMSAGFQVNALFENSHIETNYTCAVILAYCFHFIGRNRSAIFKAKCMAYSFQLRQNNPEKEDERQTVRPFTFQFPERNQFCSCVLHRWMQLCGQSVIESLGRFRGFPVIYFSSMTHTSSGRRFSCSRY